MAPPSHQEKEDERKKLNLKLYETFSKEKDGQLKMVDEQEVQRQRGVVWTIVKEVGNSILDGRDLSTLTLPIDLFEPCSFLEKMCVSWSYAPTFLTAAAHATDPVERLKLVMSFVLAGIHLAPAARKPFNPILGETYEANFADGTQIFCEQISHHPPISSWQVTGPKNIYHFYGHGQTAASARGNSLKGYQTGLNCVEFGDGTKITFTLPVLHIGGVMWGERVLYYEDVVSFKDEKNKLQCDITFNAEAVGFVKGLFTKAKQPVDYFRGEIIRSSTEKGKKKDVVAVVDGSWLDHLDVDGKRLWSVETTLPHVIFPADDPLPSDCRFRDDLVALAEKDIPTARESKLMLEERQRYDAKLRANTPKPKIGKGGKEKAPQYKDVPAAQAGTKTAEKEKTKVAADVKVANGDVKVEKAAKEKKTKK